MQKQYLRCKYQITIETIKQVKDEFKCCLVWQPMLVKVRCFLQEAQMIWRTKFCLCYNLKKGSHEPCSSTGDTSVFIWYQSWLFKTVNQLLRRKLQELTHGHLIYVLCREITIAAMCFIQYPSVLHRVIYTS